MPSLLEKLAYYDPQGGRHFVVADDGFFWKEGKKAPEESKVTKLMQSRGWDLKNGNDVWLIFKRPGQPGELFVIRKSKKWYFDLPGVEEEQAAGQGLQSLGEALAKGAFGGRAKAMTASPGATGLRSRRDYGEPDSIIELEGGVKRGGKTAKAALYVTGVTYSGMKLDDFTCGPDRSKAARFGRYTAKSLKAQLARSGVKAHIQSLTR